MARRLGDGARSGDSDATNHPGALVAGVAVSASVEGAAEVGAAAAAAAAVASVVAAVAAVAVAAVVRRRRNEQSRRSCAA